MRSFKKVVVPIVFLALILFINRILMMGLKPYNYFRNDVHNMETNKYDDVFIGSSHGKAAIQPEVIDKVTGRKSVNMCLGGQYPIDSYYIIKEMCRKNKPKRVIYELDPGYWVTKASLGPDYAQIYEELPWSSVKMEYFMDKMLRIDFRATLFPWYVYRQGVKEVLPRIKERLSEPYKSYKDSFYDNPLQSYGPEGAINIHRIDAPKTEDNMVLWNKNKLQDQSVDYFNKLLELCKEKDIELVVITTPVPKETIDKYHANFTDAFEFFNKYMKDRGTLYYNFNNIRIEEFDYTFNGFSDYEGHMYEDQGKVFSKGLGKFLQKDFAK